MWEVLSPLPPSCQFNTKRPGEASLFSTSSIVPAPGSFSLCCLEEGKSRAVLWVDVTLFSWGALVFCRSSASKLYHSCPPLELSSINSPNRIKLTSEKPLGPHWISWLLTASEASAVPSFPMVPVLLLGVKESPSPILPLKLPLIGFCTNCYEIAELEKHKLVQNLYTPLHINKLLWVKL